MRNALVWASQGIYSRYEYLEKIYFDAIFGSGIENFSQTNGEKISYDAIGTYKVKNYKEQPHEYVEG